MSDTVQWARLMNFDEVLIDVDLLFHRLGSTFPSIDGETMRELILGRYEIARSQDNEKWLRDARKWAEAFLPSNWIDHRLCRWKKGKHLQIRRPKASSSSTVTSSMAKDHRITIDGQDLPCIRSDAASTSDGTGMECQPSISRDDPVPQERPPQVTTDNIRDDSVPQVLPTTKESQSSSKRQISPITFSSQGKSSRSARKRNTQDTTQTQPKRAKSQHVPVKPHKNQFCPVKGCHATSRYLREHVYKNHLPNLFSPLELWQRIHRNTQRQRINGLRQIATSILSDSAKVDDLVAFVNRRIGDVIINRVQVWGPLQGDMEALCRFAGWEIPEEFQVYPRLNSPAALLYWRVLVYLVGQLPGRLQREFMVSYELPEDPSDGATSARSSNTGNRQDATYSSATYARQDNGNRATSARSSGTDQSTRALSARQDYSHRATSARSSGTDQRTRASSARQDYSHRATSARSSGTDYNDRAIQARSSNSQESTHIRATSAHQDLSDRATLARSLEFVYL